MNEEDPSPHTSDNRAPRRRRYPWVLLGVLMALLAIVAAAPLLLSSPRINGAVLDWYNDSIPGEVRIERVSLSWLGGQSARGVVITDPQGRTALRLAELTTDLSLVDALRGRLPLGRTLVRGLDVDLTLAADGTSNLSTALGAEPAAAEPAGGAPIVPVTGNMTLVDSRISIAAPGIDPIVLDGLSGDVAMNGRDAPVRLRFSGTSRQGDLVGRIDLDGQINDLFHDGQLNTDAATANVDASVEDLPVDALDRLLGYDGMLSAALGDRTSIRMQAGGGAEQQTISIDARSPNAELHVEGIVADQWFRLREPATLRLDVTTELTDALNRRAPDSAGARLAGPLPLHLNIAHLDVPLEAFTPAEMAFKAELTAADAVRVTGIENVGEVRIEDFRILVSSTKLADRLRVFLAGEPITQDGSGDLTVQADFYRLIDGAGQLQLDKTAIEAESSIKDVPTVVVDTILQQDGLLVDAVGDTFDLSVDADTDEAGNTNVSLNLDAGRIRTEPIQLVITDHLVLKGTARLQATVTPRLWDRLLGDDTPYRLSAPSQWSAGIEELRLPLPTVDAPAFQPGLAQLRVAVSSESMSLTAAADATETRVEDLRIDISAEKGLDDFAFDVSLGLAQPAGILQSLNASPLRIALAGRTGLNDDASLTAVTSTLETRSKGINIDAGTSIEPGFTRLTLTEPASFQLTLTPELAAAWQDSTAPTVTLQRNTAVQGTLESLRVPLSPFQLAGMQARGNANVEGMVPLESPGGTVTHIDDPRVAFQFTGEEGGRGNLELDGNVRSGGDEPGVVALQASARDLLDSQGSLAADTMTLEVDGRLQRLPVALVDQVLGLDGTATASLGTTADVALSSRLERMRGPVSVELSAQHAQAKIKARMQNEGLTLTEPLVAQLEATPQLGSQVLAKIHPIFETTQRAEQPIRLEIPAEGVLVPVEDYDFNRIEVPELTLDFGKLVLKSGWLLRGVIGLGQQFGKLESVQKEEWVAWFTPGVMRIEDGRIQYSRRVDLLLAEKLHLATWGSADVSGDRSELVLAFMPDTMERVFSITVAGDDALRVPITGPLSGPSINFKTAGADLARLRAQEEVSDENPLAGALLGAVTGKATGGGGPVPPASVTPLPWIEQLEALDAAEAQDNETRPSESSPESSPATQADQAQRRDEPSTEERVIKGLIDIFGNKKKE